MKRAWTLLALASLLAPAPAARAATAMELLTLAPTPPSDPCRDRDEKRRKALQGGDPDTEKAYTAKVYEVLDRVRAELRDLRRANEREARKDADAMRADALRQSGITPDQAQRIQPAAKGSKADKEKVADEQMEEKLGLSREEAKAMKKMDRESRKAWAKAYATQMAAEMEASGAATSPAALERARRGAGGRDRLERMDAMQREIDAPHKKLAEGLRDLDERRDGAELRAEIAREKKKLGELVRNKAPVELVKQQEDRIRQTELAYCDLMTPKYLDLARDYGRDLRSVVPRTAELEQLGADQTYDMTGMKKAPPVRPGEKGYLAVEEYLVLLTKVYQYAPTQLERLDVGAAP